MAYFTLYILATDTFYLILMEFLIKLIVPNSSLFLFPEKQFKHKVEETLKMAICALFYTKTTKKKNLGHPLL